MEDFLRDGLLNEATLYNLFGQPVLDAKLNDPNAYAATDGDGKIVYLGDRFFDANRTFRSQGLLHEGFHLLGLTDVQLAKAAGVFEHAWESLEENEQLIKSSDAFDQQLKERCK